MLTAKEKRVSARFFRLFLQKNTFSYEKICVCQKKAVPLHAFLREYAQERV